MKKLFFTTTLCTMLMFAANFAMAENMEKGPVTDHSKRYHSSSTDRKDLKNPQSHHYPTAVEDEECDPKNPEDLQKKQAKSSGSAAATSGSRRVLPVMNSHDENDDHASHSKPVSADPKKDMQHTNKTHDKKTNPQDETHTIKTAYKNKALLFLDSNFSYRTHDLKEAFLKDSNYRVFTLFGIGGNSEITFAKNGETNLTVGVVAAITYGPQRGKDFDQRFDRYPSVQVKNTQGAVLKLNQIIPQPKMELAQAFFYVKKGAAKNHYTFSMGHVAGTTEMFNVRFADIMPGADPYRFSVHADVRVDNSKKSAPGFQLGEDGTFAKHTGKIDGVRRDPLYFKTYSALYSESNNRYAPKVNFILPSFHGLKAGVSFTPDQGARSDFGGDFNRIPMAYNKKNVFPGDYKNVIEGGVNYSFSNDNIEISASVVGEYGKHELSCDESRQLCTQNYHELKAYSLSGMASWKNLSFFATWADLKNSGHKIKLGDLQANDFDKSQTDYTNNVIHKDFSSSAVTTPQPITVGGTKLVARTDENLTNSDPTKPSIANEAGGYAEIQRKNFETTYLEIGLSYRINMASIGGSYFRSKAGQFDAYGGHAVLDRFTGIASYQIYQGMTPYIEVSHFKTKDQSTAIDSNLIQDLKVASGAAGYSTADYNKLKAAAQGTPDATNVAYVNQIGKFSEPLKGNKGWVLLAGIKFQF